MTSLLGAKIKKLREKKGLSLSALGKLTRSNRSYLYSLENGLPDGKQINPTGKKLSLIAEALNVTTDFLLDDNAKDPIDKIIDEAMFRNFQKLSSTDRKKIRKIIEDWGENL